MDVWVIWSMVGVLCYVFLIIRPTPTSTRTDTLFPDTTLFRSYLHSLINEGLEGRGEVGRRLGLAVHGHVMQSFQRGSHPRDVCSPLPSPAPNGPGYSTAAHDSDDQGTGLAGPAQPAVHRRPEDRTRADEGTEGVKTGRLRGSPIQTKKKKQ